MDLKHRNLLQQALANVTEVNGALKLLLEKQLTDDMLIHKNQDFLFVLIDVVIQDQFHDPYLLPEDKKKEYIAMAITHFQKNPIAGVNLDSSTDG